MADPFVPVELVTPFGNDPPLRGPFVIAPPMRLTTLLVAATLGLPLFSDARSFPAQLQQRSPNNWLNPDTSRGSPKTLLPGDPRQPFLPLQLPPQVRSGLFPNPNTSVGSAKVLLPVDPRQRFLPLQLPPQARAGFFPNPDTSQGKPNVQRADQIAPRVDAPFFQQLEGKDHQRQNPSTAVGSAKTLIAESTLPDGTTEVQVFWVQHDPKEWLPTDTTAETAKTLKDETKTPAGTRELQLFQVRHDREWLPEDTTAETAKTLKSETQPPDGTVAPFVIPIQHSYREWLNPNTALGTAETLRPESLPPGESLLFSTIQYVWKITDTSNSTQQVAPVPVVTAISPHSWFVKGIGIKTKISVNSQVDGDIGDTP